MADETQGKSPIETAFTAVAAFIEKLISGGHAHGNGHGHGEWWQHTALHEFIKDKVGEWMISRALFTGSLFIPLLFLASDLFPPFFALVFGWFFLLLPILAVGGALIGFWGAWVWYARSWFIFTRTKPILLEVKMPTEITKSPRAMELVLSNLWIRASETTFIDKYWHGGVRPYYALELVSLGGQIHFYIWCSRDTLRNVIESNFYAQYPEVEIVEAEDYAVNFHYDEHKYKCFVGDYIFESNHVDRHSPQINAYPIKTYVDYELDKDPKEELKVEPFAQCLEVLSMLNPDEQAWVHIVFRPHLTKTWKNIVEEEVRKLRKQASINPGKENAPDDDEKKYGFPRPTWKETEQMRTMERNLGKLPFEFQGHMIFIGPRNNFRSNEYTAIRWIFRPFANPNYLVMLRPRHGHNDFDYPWQDWHDHRYEHETHRWLDKYRRRMVFHPPWQEDDYNITSVEVLATIWHPPSRTIQTPGLRRIPSAKAAPPPNLPV